MTADSPVDAGVDDAGADDTVACDNVDAAGEGTADEAAVGDAAAGEASGTDAAGAVSDADDAPHDISVCVVDPQTPGNVGTIARAMKNFGFSDLLLVDPPDIDEGSEAYGYAGHAREDVLPNAEAVSFEEVCENYHTVGTTAITAEDSRNHERFPFATPAELREDLRGVGGPVCLVFGREDTGLTNDELERLDRVISVPASPEYPVMNLGQAATVTLYELRDLMLTDTQLPAVEHHRADPETVERLHEYWDAFLDGMGQREHRHDKAVKAFRRLLGRADPTDREVTTMLGVLRRATDQLEDRKELLDELDREDDLRR